MSTPFLASAFTAGIVDEPAAEEDIVLHAFFTLIGGADIEIECWGAGTGVKKRIVVWQRWASNGVGLKCLNNGLDTVTVLTAWNR